MNIYWCDNCNVPVLDNKKTNDIDIKNDPYCDIEDEVVEYLMDVGLKNPEKYFNFYLSLKDKVNRAIENNWIDNLREDLLTSIDKEVLNKLHYFVLKYLNWKLEKGEKKHSTSSEYTCPYCKSTVKYISKDIRPVFVEEKIMLSVFLETDLTKKNIWNTVGNRYIIDGEVTYIDTTELYNHKDIDKKADEVIKRIKENTISTDFSEFIEVNKKHFKYIDNRAIDFIKNSSGVLKDRYKIVSFSGGKDSTVVSDLVTRALGTQDVLHIFGDTTLEFPSTYEYIERIKKRPVRPPFLPVEKSRKDFMKLCNIFGPPSRVMSWCCTIFKTGPIGELIRQISEEQDILTFYGIRRSESSSRSQYDKISKSPKITKQLVISPIIDWLDADIWLYILTRDIDFNYAYRYGFTRVGCWCCPNNSKRSEFLAKIYIKEKSKKWHSFLIEFAKKIGKPDPEVYIHNGNWKARQGGRGLVDKEISVSLEAKPCVLEDDAKNYKLTKPISDELYELFKPFGKVVKDIGNQMLNEVYIFDPKGNEPRFVLQGRIGSKQLKVVLIQEKNHFLLFQRIECQLRKYQSCIYCTACPNVCPYDAISLKNQYGEDYYNIDENKCKHCMKCIAHFHKGCLVTRTMMDY